MHDRLENDFAKFWIDNGILFYVYKPYSIINLDAAKQIVADRLKLQGEQTIPVFCDIRGIKSSEKAARDYIAQQGSALCSAKAVMAAPGYSFEMMNFYLETSKPRIQVQIFTEKEMALEYLEDFKE